MFILKTALAEYAARYPKEHANITRMQALLAEPACFLRANAHAHFTASSLIIDRVAPNAQTLLCHHKKLNIWVQPGGHCDGNADILAVAHTEAREETGIAAFDTLSHGVFDIDIHAIPEYGAVPAHFHYDVRFLLCAKDTHYTVSDESHALAWVAFADMEQFTQDPSLLRMRTKWHAFCQTQALYANRG